MKDYHKNEISKTRMSKMKKASLYPSMVIIVILTLMNIYFFLNSIFLFILVESVMILIISTMIIGDYLSDSASPKYIKWNNIEIKLINLRGKKEIISWSDIDEIEWIGEYHSSVEQYPDYLISLKGRISPNRYVSPEIGKN